MKSSPRSTCLPFCIHAPTQPPWFWFWFWFWFWLLLLRYRAVTLQFVSAFLKTHSRMSNFSVHGQQNDINLPSMHEYHHSKNTSSVSISLRPLRKRRTHILICVGWEASLTHYLPLGGVPICTRYITLQSHFLFVFTRVRFRTEAGKHTHRV